MTDQERTELRAMTVPQIRRAQEIIRMQLPLAYESRNTTALVRLQEWENDYADEIMRRLMAGDA
jgi:hypothetical protein